MNNKLIHKALTTIVAILAITACGGGSKEPMPEPTPTPPSPIVAEPQFGFSANVSSAQEATVGALTRAGKDENIALRLYVSEAGFSTDTASNAVMTKGTIIDQAGFLSAYHVSGVGVFGYKSGSQVLGSASSGSKVTYASTTGRWFAAEQITWNVGEKMNFFAYAPYIANSDNDPVIATNSNNGSPTISYITHPYVGKQVDLLVAKSIDFARPSTNNFVVPLTFKHALSTIEFKISKDFPAVTINSITLKGVKGKGVYNVKEEVWSNSEENSDYEIWVNTKFTIEQIQSEAKVNDYNSVMFLLPQAFADETSTIEVTYALASNPNTPLTFTAPIKTSTDKWEQGKKYTYILVPAKAPDPVVTTERTSTFEVADIPSFTYEGGTNTITVKSETEVKTLIDGVVTGDPQIIQQPWNVEYSTDEGVTYSKTAPAWLTIARDEATNNAVITVQPQTDVMTTILSGIKWGLEKGDRNNPHNLANQTYGGSKVENTANCYIVDGPGWYKIPLVYGNAIKNGTANMEAYKSASNIFVTHCNRAISDPYIYNNNGCFPSSASIVWQDADKEVITEVSLCDNNTFLKFHIERENISYDNAVLVVKDANGTVMWSWHIWVTNYTLEHSDFTHTSSISDDGDGVTRTIMPVNLGYTPEVSIVTETKCIDIHCMVKFIMTDTETATTKQAVKKVECTGMTKEFTTHIDEKNLYYQWGRKDPFTPVGKTISGPVSYVTSIQTPDIFYTDPNNAYNGMWLSSPFSDCRDAWHFGTGTTNDKGVADAKTVYDPCPVGYCVPNSYTFCGLDDSTLPRLGDLDCFTRTQQAKGESGYYWVASSTTGDYGVVFNSTMGIRSVNHQAAGCAIRGVKEGTGGAAATSPDHSDVNVDGYDTDDPDITPTLQRN